MHLRSADGFGIVTAIAVVILLGLQIDAGSGQNKQVTWYVVDGKLNSKGQTLNLGDGPQRVALGNGWSCTVASTSKQLPAHEARTTICEKSSEAFQFVVQCEPSRMKDHTQVGFLGSNRRLADFIEVGCELK